MLRQKPPGRGTPQRANKEKVSLRNVDVKAQSSLCVGSELGTSTGSETSRGTEVMVIPRLLESKASQCPPTRQRLVEGGLLEKFKTPLEANVMWDVRTTRIVPTCYYPEPLKGRSAHAKQTEHDKKKNTKKKKKN